MCTFVRVDAVPAEQFGRRGQPALAGHGEAIAPQSTVVSSEMKLRSGDGMVAKRSLEGVGITSARGESLQAIVELISEGISVTPSKVAKKPKVKHF
jgi:hypothetical protein